MTSWKRWQDWATIVLGALVFAAPLVFGIEFGTAAAWTAYVLGVAIMVAGVVSSSMEKPNVATEWIPLVLGALLFVAPWFLGLGTASTIAWLAWILGGLVVVNAISELVVFRHTPASP